jgi:alkylation response protein AidB-like acyl-CoA dehydrogenase
VDTGARRDGAGWKLSGRKTQVLHGPQAQWLVVSARSDGEAGSLGLFLVDPRSGGVTLQPMRRIDELSVAEVTLHEVPVPQAQALLFGDDAWARVDEIEDIGAAAACAQAVGAMEAALQLTLEHLRTRRQFGVPLASFQVLQHRAADMHIAIELARSMVLLAATALTAQDPQQRSAKVSAAKVVVGRAARQVGDSAIQLHGGMGMTADHAVGHHVRRLAVLRASFGDTDFHARRLAALGDLLEEAL